MRMSRSLGAVTVVLDHDVRFSVPLYTQAEAARYLSMPPTTLKFWTHPYVHTSRSGRRVTSGPLVTQLHVSNNLEPSVPFIGLAEAIFLASLKRAGVPIRGIRPALDLVREKIGVEHALASRRLWVVGAQLLLEVSDKSGLDPHTRSSLIVLKNGQYVFREVVEQYLKRVEYADDGYAARVSLPGYEVANIIADPNINFGQPYFASSGAPVNAVLSRLRAGEAPQDVADDFDLCTEELVEVVDRQQISA